MCWNFETNSILQQMGGVSGVSKYSIRLSTVKRAYEFSGAAHVTTFRKHG